MGDEKLWVALLERGGSLVILGGFLWLFISRLIPTFVNTVTEQRLQFLSALKDQSDDHKTAIIGLKNQLKDHTDAITNLTNCQNNLVQQHKELNRIFEKATQRSRRG